MKKQLILEGIDKAQRVLARYVMPRAPEMPTIDFWERRAKEREAVINELLGILDNKDFVCAVNAAVAEMQDFIEDGTPRPQVPGPAPFIAEPIRAKPAPVCSATASVMSELQRRSAVGLKKYGVSVGDRKDLTLSQWFKHLQEELLDASVYIEKARTLDNSGELERLRQENAQLKQDWQQVHNDNLRLTKKLQSVRLVLRE